MRKEAVLNFFVFSLFVLSLSFFFFSENKIHNSISTSNLNQDITVVIDAGHGGEDGGAVKDKIVEKDINLSVSERLEMFLNFFGVKTEMIRREDVSLEQTENTLRKRKIADIKKRVEIVKNKPNAVLISIHQNSFPQEACSGAQVFYSKNNSISKPLAEKIQTSLKNGVDINNRRVEKIADKSIYILENVNCPAVLVECGFITNTQEAKLLVSEEYQTKLAGCIATGFMLEYTKEMK